MVKLVGDQPAQRTLAIGVAAADDEITRAIDAVDREGEGVIGHAMDGNDGEIEGGIGVIGSAVSGDSREIDRQIAGIAPANPVEIHRVNGAKLPRPAAPLHISVIRVHERGRVVENEFA